MYGRILWIILILVVCRPWPAAGDASAPPRRGVVVDESGGVIAGARLLVRSAHGGVLQHADTAADGTFALDSLPAGTYWLEVTAPHFRARQATLRVDAPAEAPPLRIMLRLAPVESDVTVTAQRGMIAEIDRTPPIVTVRDEDEIRGRPLATIGNALEGATGVMVQQSTYGQVSPFVRGMTGYQVLNLIDGVRFNNSTFRSGPNQYLAFVDPSQTGRIEVMSGPASSQFGSDALGGAIQLLTPALGFGGGAGPSVSGMADLFGGSADQSIGADAGLFIRARRLSWTLGGARRRLDDLRGGGRDSHHALRRFFGLDDAQVRSVTGDRHLGSGFTQSSSHTKVAARLGADQNLTLWYQRSGQEDVRGYKDLWGGLGRLRSDFDPQQLQFGYARYERLGLGPLDWVSGTFSINAQDDGSVRQGLRFTDRIVRDDVHVDALGYALQAGARVASRHRLVFGGEVYDERVDARRDETDPRTGAIEQKRPLYPNGSRYRTSGLFVQDVVELVRGSGGSALTAHLGGRFTRVDVETDAERNRGDAGQSFGVVDSTRSYQDWTFNTGVTWAMTSAVSLHTLVGRGFRAPNLNDLGALGLNDLGYEIPAESVAAGGGLIGASDGEGVRSTGRPVADLTSERLFNFEIGSTVNWKGVYGRAHVFDAELQDPIVRRTLLFPAAAVPPTLAGIPVTPIAQTAAQREEGVAGVATAFDPRAVKAFVNDGRARYRGVDALVRYRVSTRWLAEANYTYLAGNDLDPTRPVRRLPPQQGVMTLRYQRGGLFSWIEASVAFSGAQEKLSGGDLTDERIGAARSRNEIGSFFQGGLVSPYILPGRDGVSGTPDDVFGPTGETAAQIRDRVLPIGATINGVTVVDDATRVPLYGRTAGFASLNLSSSLALTDRVDVALALMNVFDRNYRIHGSGVDAPGLNAFVRLRVAF